MKYNTYTIFLPLLISTFLAWSLGVGGGVYAVPSTSVNAIFDRNAVEAGSSGPVVTGTDLVPRSSEVETTTLALEPRGFFGFFKSLFATSPSTTDLVSRSETTALSLNPRWGIFSFFKKIFNWAKKIVSIIMDIYDIYKTIRSFTQSSYDVNVHSLLLTASDDSKDVKDSVGNLDPNADPASLSTDLSNINHVTENLGSQMMYIKVQVDNGDFRSACSNAISELSGLSDVLYDTSRSMAGGSGGYDYYGNKL